LVLPECLNPDLNVSICTAVLCASSYRLHEAGAVKVYAVCTHGILSGSAITNINNSRFECVVVTNTIPQEENMKMSAKLQVGCFDSDLTIQLSE